MKLRNKTAVIMCALGLILVVFWLSFSAIATKVVNKKISRIGEYRGTVSAVHLNFWRGAYSLENFKLVKIANTASVPFVNVKRIDFNVRWKALLHGVFVGDMELFSPEVNFVDADKPEGKQGNLKGAGADGKKAVKELSPLKIDRILIHDGRVHFKRLDGDPPVDIYLHEIRAEITNLTNSKDLSQSLMATAEARGRAMSEGRFDLNLAMNPFAAQPTFETRTRLTFSLPELNDFLKEYLSLEAKAGRVDLFIEGAAAEGQFIGYVKPLVQGIDFIEMKNKDKSPGDIVKGGVAKVLSNLFENRKKGDNATKIELQGSFNDPDIKILDAILSFFRNAFFEGITPGFEKKDEPHVTPAGTLSENESEPEATKATSAETA